MKENTMQKKIWVGVLALTFAVGNVAFAADEAASKAKTGSVSWVGGNFFKFKADGDAECGVSRGCAAVWKDESMRTLDETKVGQKVECVAVSATKVPKKTAYKIAEEQRTQGETHKKAKSLKLPKHYFECNAV